MDVCYAFGHDLICRLKQSRAKMDQNVCSKADSKCAVPILAHNTEEMPYTRPKLGHSLSLLLILVVSALVTPSAKYSRTVMSEKESHDYVLSILSFLHWSLVCFKTDLKSSVNF